jgi:NDP-sugar pyrophosphorylase family protein
VKSSLVLMAAGLGSRFGGTKQLVPVGKNGETLLDFTIQDALRVGMTDVVIIVRSEIVNDMKSHVERLHPEGLDFRFVLQDRYGPARAKPWGTTHAVISASEAVEGPFILANADDYYGPSSIEVASEQLPNLDEQSAALITFELNKTLSSSGPVTRGVCDVQNGLLAEVIETEGLFYNESNNEIACVEGNILKPDTPVSMNLWCFHPSILSSLQSLWEEFLEENSHSETAECLLPVCISTLMDRQDFQVSTVPSQEEWTGLTNPDDLELVRNKINNLRR